MSVGGMTESVVKSSSSALVEWANRYRADPTGSAGALESKRESVATMPDDPLERVGLGLLRMLRGL